MLVLTTGSNPRQQWSKSSPQQEGREAKPSEWLLLGHALRSGLLPEGMAVLILSSHVNQEHRDSSSGEAPYSGDSNPCQVGIKTNPNRHHQLNRGTEQYPSPPCHSPLTLLPLGTVGRRTQPLTPRQLQGLS